MHSQNEAPDWGSGEGAEREPKESELFGQQNSADVLSSSTEKALRKLYGGCWAHSEGIVYRAHWQTVNGRWPTQPIVHTADRLQSATVCLKSMRWRGLVGSCAHQKHRTDPLCSRVGVRTFRTYRTTQKWSKVEWVTFSKPPLLAI